MNPNITSAEETLTIDRKLVLKSPPWYMSSRSLKTAQGQPIEFISLSSVNPLFFASVRGGRLVMNSISNRSLGVRVTSGVICALGIIFIGTSALFLLETEVDFEGSGTSSRELPNSFVGTLRELA